MGVIRSLQFVATLVAAAPIGMVGVLNVLEGQYLHGALFLGAALGLLAVSEYLYVRLTDGTVERVRRLKGYRPWRGRGSDGDE